MKETGNPHERNRGTPHERNRGVHMEETGESM